MRGAVGTDTQRCGEQMANDARRKSGRVCDLTIGHAGSHASQYSRAGQAARTARWDRRFGTPCIVCGAPIVDGSGHDAGCMAAEPPCWRSPCWCADCRSYAAAARLVRNRKPRTWHELGRIIARAEYRWRKRQRRHGLEGSWAHPLVVEAMYLLDALYVARHERAA